MRACFVAGDKLRAVEKVRELKALREALEQRASKASIAKEEAVAVSTTEAEVAVAGGENSPLARLPSAGAGPGIAAANERLANDNVKLREESAKLMAENARLKEEGAKLAAANDRLKEEGAKLAAKVASQRKEVRSGFRCCFRGSGRGEAAPAA